MQSLTAQDPRAKDNQKDKHKVNAPFDRHVSTSEKEAERISAALTDEFSE